MARTRVHRDNGRSVRQWDEYSDVSLHANETGGGELVEHARTGWHEQPLVYADCGGDDQRDDDQRGGDGRARRRFAARIWRRVPAWGVSGNWWWVLAPDYHANW